MAVDNQTILSNRKRLALKHRVKLHQIAYGGSIKGIPGIGTLLLFNVKKSGHDLYSKTIAVETN